MPLWFLGFLGKLEALTAWNQHFNKVIVAEKLLA